MIKRKEGHLVDALALRGDEGRGTLRKARGRCERSVIPGSPNGATHSVVASERGTGQWPLSLVPEAPGKAGRSG